MTTITKTTADAIWDDPLPHGGTYTPPVGQRITGVLEFDEMVFTVIRDEDVPDDRRKRLRARLPVIRRRWWR